MNYKKPKEFRERKERWTVGVDLLPLVHLQAALDGKKEIYSLKAHVSTSELTGKKAGSLKHIGLDFQKSNVLLNKTVVKVGSACPHDEFRKPMEEVFEDITANLGVEQAVIETCGCVHQNKNLDHFNCLDGIQEIYEHNRRYSNKSRILARTLNLRIANPRWMIVAELFKRGIIKTTKDEKLKRLRSILATNYLEFDDHTKGYDMLFPEALEFQRSLRGKSFWKHVAIPELTRLFANSNEAAKAIYVYRLDGRHDWFAF